MGNLRVQCSRYNNSLSPFTSRIQTFLQSVSKHGESAQLYSDTGTIPAIFFSLAIFKDIDACHCKHSPEEALHSWDSLVAKWDSVQIDLF